MGEIRTPFRGRRARKTYRSFPQGAAQSLSNSMGFSLYYKKEYSSLLVVDGAGSPQTAPAAIPPVMAPHRYWRLYITANNGDVSACSITELEMFTSRGGANVATGGTASANNFRASMPPAEAFDANYFDVTGTTGSTWGTLSCVANETNWIQYDFGAGNDKGIVGIKMSARVSPFQTQTPKDFVVQYSDDGVTWANAWDVINANGWTGSEQRSFYHPLF